eukprot:3933063-Amphidinium_carterae.1
MDTLCVIAVGSIACKLNAATLRGFCKVGVSIAIVRHTMATQMQRCVLLLSQSGCSQNCLHKMGQIMCTKLLTKEGAGKPNDQRGSQLTKCCLPQCGCSQKVACAKRSSQAHCEDANRVCWHTEWPQKSCSQKIACARK